MLQVLNGPTIERGESLSDGIDCSGGELVRITMPAEWTEAPLTFEFSSDGEFYNDMFGLDGYAVKVDVVVPGSGVIVPVAVGRAVAWIKFRSGTRGNPVEQQEQRQFAVTIVKSSVELQPFKEGQPKRMTAKKPAAKAAKKKR